MVTKLCNCKRQPFEQPVIDGLSISPYQMMEMAKEGTPISTSNLGLTFDEGFSELDFQPDLEHRRGVDIADMWNAQQDFKSKVRKAKAEGKFLPVENE